MSRHRIHACGLAASLVTLAALTLPGPIAALDRHLYDVLLRFVAGSGTASGRVALVAVDDKSLTEVGQWPWPHSVTARLFDRLKENGAAVVALDAILEGPSLEGGFLGADDPGATDALVTAIHRSKVVVGHVLTFGTGAAATGPCVVLPAEAAASEPMPAEALRARLFQATSVDCSGPELTGAASSSGYLNFGTDSDGVLRRLPVVMWFRNGTVPSLALAAVQLASGSGRPTITSGRGHPLALAGEGADALPLGERGTIALRFRSGERAFTRLSAVDVLEGRVTRGALEGRITFVGTTTALSPDFVRTPVSPQHARLDLHATAADNLLQRDFISSAPYARVLTVAVTLALGPLVAGLIAWMGYQRGAIAGAGLVIGLWLAAAFAMRSLSTFVSPALPTFAALGTIAATALAQLGRERFRPDDEQRRRQQTQELLVQSLMTMVEIRDPSTGQHARRTQGYCRLLAQRLAHVPGFREYLTQERIEYVSWLAPLHDIGKVGIRDAVLGKPSALSEEELNEMRRHPMVGFEAISRAQRHVGMDSAHDDALLQIAKDIVYTHHERWDGSGYPRGLKGPEIPIPGRIVAVVDVYDALVEARPYRRRIPHQEAVASIASGRGTQFEPEVVDAFLMVANDFLELGTRLREESMQA